MDLAQPSRVTPIAMAFETCDAAPVDREAADGAFLRLTAPAYTAPIRMPGANAKTPSQRFRW
ncbi:hypothetical protein SUDANB70_01891 [Streptomyces sp. enrichment culture]